MTNEDAKKIIDARIECIERQISGTDGDCIHNNCDGCKSNYAQGCMEEQKEALKIASKVLRQVSGGTGTKKEEKIHTLEAIIQECEEYQWKRKETLFEIIKDLEKEPCDDTISRKAVLKIYKEWFNSCNIADKKESPKAQINALPPVTPQPKIGRWITWKEAGNEIPSETRYECSLCHDAAQTLCNGLDLLSPYCPNCGAKMEG